MKSVKSRYNYNPNQPLSKQYQDAEVFNAYYKCFDTQTNQQLLLSHFKSENKTQVSSLYKKFTTIKDKMDKMSKQNITEIHDVILQPKEKSLFLIIDYMQGGSIMDYIGKVYTLDSKASTRVVLGALHGLQQLHQHDLVNSFINLQNIQIDHQGNSKLSFKCMIYKTIYLSPEFRKDHVKSKQSDYYSLGVCLYRLIYGQFPYKTQKTEELLELVRKGPVMIVERGAGCFPVVGAVWARDIITQLLHFNPQLRGSGVDKLQHLETTFNSKPIPHEIQTKLFKGKYIRLLDNRLQPDESEFLVLDKKQKKLLKLLVYSGTKVDIEQYVKSVINKYGKASSEMFLKIYQYQTISEKYLTIVFTYTGEDDLLNYRQALQLKQGFNANQIQYTIDFIKSSLKALGQSHQYLTNETIFVKNGTLRIQFPPFKTNRILSMFKKILASKENYFIAPEVLQGKGGSSKSDSWSVAVLEYWMMYNEMPKFDSKGTLVMNKKEKLPKDKLLYFHKSIQKNPTTRPDFFKNPEQQFNQFLPNETANNDKNPMSFRLNSPLKKNENQLQKHLNEDLQESSPKNSRLQNKQSIKQKNTDTLNSDQSPQKNNTKPNIVSNELLLEGGEIENNNVDRRRQQKGRRSKARQYGLQRSGSQLNHDKQPQQQPLQSDINYKYKTPITVTSQSPLPPKHENKFNMKLFDQKQQIKPLQQITAKQKNLTAGQKKIPIEQDKPSIPLTEQIISNATSLGTKFAALQRSYTKSIRVSIKCIIAIVLYLFIFYFDFFKITAQLISSRLSFAPMIIPIRAFTSDSTTNINYTLVTTTPTDTYSMFYNCTLPLLRDQYKCVLNDYSVHSNVTAVIQSSGFVAYEVFGIIFGVAHLIIVCVVIGRLDLCKACSLCDFDSKKYYPLINYGFVILAILSLTSLHYLIYGGLFHLRLDPCLGKSTLPGLQFLMKRWSSSWLGRFIIIYIGIAIAYAVITFFLIRSNKKLHHFIYIFLLVLYFIGVGLRAIGKTYPAHQNVFGLSGELLAIIVAVCLFIIDMLFVCCSKYSRQSNQQHNLDTRSIQQYNRTQEFFFGNTGIQDDVNYEK